MAENEPGSEALFPVQPKTNVQCTLDEISLLRGLSEEHRTKLAAGIPIRSFKKRDLLVRQDEKDDTLFCILSGSAVVKSEKGMLLSVLGPGDSFGEIAFLCGKARTAMVEGQEDGEMALFSAKFLHTLIKEEPAIAAPLMLNLARELATRLATTTQMVLF
jgi:CRP/FNR family transcriptional regulator, cyclic AMP receptor protein